jgi:predicted transcriptional regulator
MDDASAKGVGGVATAVKMACFEGGARPVSSVRSRCSKLPEAAAEYFPDMPIWPLRARTPAADRLGPLERRVLDALWRRARPASVRDLQPEFADIAYTTLMTTLDRLHRKALLDRVKQGRAFVYQPRLSRHEFQSARAADVLEAALAGDRTDVEPLLSFFVRAVSDRDRELLDELEALVRARRHEMDDTTS